jgi:hypothetical protein
MVAVIAPDGTQIAKIWFGPDPDAKWQWDGAVRIGDVGFRADGPSPVWQTVQRYSDGSYRHLEARIITTPKHHPLKLGFSGQA